MARRGGFSGGMPGNMNNLMKQAQKMQKQMEDAQKQLQETDYEGTAGGGAVKVIITGNKEVKAVKLDEDIVDPDDIETLEEAIAAATNAALRAMEDDAQNKMGRLAGGLGGGLGF